MPWSTCASLKPWKLPKQLLPTSVRCAGASSMRAVNPGFWAGRLHGQIFTMYPLVEGLQADLGMAPACGRATQGCRQRPGGAAVPAKPCAGGWHSQLHDSLSLSLASGGPGGCLTI